jgi:hypothetical protein
MQYLAWALAGAYLIDTWAATGYNLAASAFVVAVYDHWSDALPWHWYQAWASPLSSGELALMVLTWVLLAVVGVVGLRYLRRGVAGSRSLSFGWRRGLVAADAGYDQRT